MPRDCPWQLLIEKKRVMTKNIVEKKYDNGIGKGLVLNTSYDIFYLGKSISKYENLVHHKKLYDDPSRFDDYEIEIHGYNIELWVWRGKIRTIIIYDSNT